MAWARHAGMAGMITDVVTTMDELERFAALAFAAGQAAERNARIAAQDELVTYKEACLKAEHEAQRARGELAAAVAAEREACAILCEIEDIHEAIVNVDWLKNCAENDDEGLTRLYCAAAIRARGQS